ncbi:transcriptional regulator, LysR family [Burkholderia sp. D7]|nr:transcriptional regulator, LysR family [Burkholderia sp. D7]
MNVSPPLNALRAFEAAMRLNSFSRAADELSVTPGAVAQQIRHLEEWLGVALFTRHIRRIQPTADGLAYAASVLPPLREIVRTSVGLRERHSQGVRVTMPPGFAAKWFAPRMARFLTRYPSVALHVSSSTALTAFESEPFDLAIRHFDGKAPGLESRLLCADASHVYCSPEYAQRLALQHPAGLIRATLLRDTFHPHWDAWLTTFAGLDHAHIAVIASVNVDQTLLAVEAAVHGQGVLITSALLVEAEIAAGTLIEPFDAHLPLEKAFYIVHAGSAELREPVRLFKDWLLAEAEAQSPQGRVGL